MYLLCKNQQNYATLFNPRGYLHTDRAVYRLIHSTLIESDGMFKGVVDIDFLKKNKIELDGMIVVFNFMLKRK